MSSVQDCLWSPKASRGYCHDMWLGGSRMGGNSANGGNERMARNKHSNRRVQGTQHVKEGTKYRCKKKSDSWTTGCL
jgi:hypothetical protein